MTNTITVPVPPVWTSPVNLKDNTIIQATYWNQITSNRGSIGWLQEKTSARATCNIFVAEWSAQSIPVKSSASVNSTFIVFTSNSNGQYFKRDGAIILPDDLPCLLIWKVWFYGETSNTGYTQRTTLIRRNFSNNGRIINTQTVASYFNKKYDASQVVISAAYATVAKNAIDRYYINVDHGYHTAINTRGTCHLIVNPGMV